MATPILLRLPIIYRQWLATKAEKSQDKATWEAVVGWRFSEDMRRWLLLTTVRVDDEAEGLRENDGGRARDGGTEIEEAEEDDEAEEEEGWSTGGEFVVEVEEDDDEEEVEEEEEESRRLVGVTNCPVAVFRCALLTALLKSDEMVTAVGTGTKRGGEEEEEEEE
jgi:hypothetical protein